MNCKTEEKISVIVPVYNVENKISNCIESIVNQTYKNIEIILINDGSKDKSVEICKEYAKRDSRIIVIDKENEGVSKTRNLGIDMATGKYLMFVDSDDTIPKHAIEILYKPVWECGVEYSAGDVEHIKGGCRTYAYKQMPISDIVTSDYSKIGRNIYFNQGYAVAKLYNVEIINKNNIRFNCQFSLGEDSLFVKEYLLHINSISVTNKFVYTYIHEDDESLSGKYVENIKEIYGALYDANRKLNEKYGGVANYVPRIVSVSTAEINNIYKKGSPYKSKKERLKFIKSRIKNKEFKDGIRGRKMSSRKQMLAKILYGMGSALLIDMIYSKKNLK